MGNVRTCLGGPGLRETLMARGFFADSRPAGGGPPRSLRAAFLLRSLAQTAASREALSDLPDQWPRWTEIQWRTSHGTPTELWALVWSRM